ncbi:MAG TPA: type III-A CRISPR-associated RAMP protein Csm3 [bacterium]|nr:type III-A CRISPR-associated RAMP protein Csm3 [bacterium]HOL35107.1 type III-A CRISPR-associated RAMP protein Csm3 [bacterium]HPP08368.1 type III-A CRISPR-associated RAMP protein Csm3 [bacterium]
MNHQTPIISKAVIKGCIRVVTGLRIGGPGTGVKIGGVDQPVIADPYGKPYIPGSSLKGKMRSLIEKKERVKFENGKHTCQSPESYKNCPVCKIWGIMGDKVKDAPTLTRIIVRDTFLDENSITEEMHRNLELRWTEIKVENAIDRITGTALSRSLRQLERVPAGARFSPLEIIYTCYEQDDKEIFKKIFEAMELLEHDYLGGMGSRGYGKVKFENLVIYWNRPEDYENGNTNQNKVNGGFNTPAMILQHYEEILNKLS